MIRNMCCAKDLAAFEAAPTGVLGFTAADGTPRSCAVTPYVVGGRPTVSATLALLTKAKMLRRNPSAAVLAGGVHVAGDVEVRIHASSQWFDEHLRGEELRKYPPARQLLAIPGHRRLLWWYVGRAEMSMPSPVVTVGGPDLATVTSVVDGAVHISSLPDVPPLDADEVPVGSSVPDGPACLLVHEEDEQMVDLRSVTLRGQVTQGVLRVASRHGSLAPAATGPLDQLRTLRRLRAAARADRPAIDTWNERD